MIKEVNFTQGKVFGSLIKFTVPVFFALVLQAAYGAADLLIVGQFGTAADVSAVSVGTLLMQSITSIITSLSMGTTIFMSQKIGEGKSEKCGKVVEGSIYLFAVLTVALTILAVAFAQPIATVMNVPVEAFNKCIEYITICGSGLIFITSYNVLSSILRGMGNSKMPLISVAIACAVNIAADLLFVGVFKMESAGAAYATVLAQGVSVIVSVFIIKKGGLPFKIKFHKPREYKEEISKVLKLGTPIALQGFLVSLSFLVIGGIVNTFGVIASAGVGVAEKLCSFIMLVPMAFMQSLSSVVAQNIGANKLDRAKKALFFGILSSLSVGIVTAYLSFFHGDILASIFTSDEAVIIAAWEFLRAYSIDTIFVSFMFCFIGYFNGLGKTTFVMIQGIIGSFLVRIPVSYIVSGLAGAGLFHVGLATPASSLVQIIICIGYFIYLDKKRKKTGEII